MVAILFVNGQKEKPYEVNHKDGIKTNNHWSNLEWVTHAHNIKHAWDHGLLTNSPSRSSKLSQALRGKWVGSKNPRSTPVLCITTGRIFETINSACRAYKVSQAQLSRTIAGTAKSAGKHPGTGEKLRWRKHDRRS